MAFKTSDTNTFDYSQSKIPHLKKYKNIKIDVSIVDSKIIKNLNKEHRNKDYATDVLSFPIDQKLSEDEYYLGDIVVNQEVAAEQCKEYGNTLEQEISDLVGHGVMHLLGVHHGDDH